MKSLDYMLEKALHIADENSDASVGFFMEEDVKNVLTDICYNFNFRGGMHIPTHTYIGSPTGGKVKFFHKSILDERDNLSGYQFSHIFVQGGLVSDVRLWLLSRIRSYVVLKEPCGFYDQWGVTRIEDY